MLVRLWPCSRIKERVLKNYSVLSGEHAAFSVSCSKAEDSIRIL